MIGGHTIEPKMRDVTAVLKILFNRSLTCTNFFYILHFKPLQQLRRYIERIEFLSREEMNTIRGSAVHELNEGRLCRIHLIYVTNDTGKCKRPELIPNSIETYCIDLYG